MIRYTCKMLPIETNKLLAHLLNRPPNACARRVKQNNVLCTCLVGLVESTSFVVRLGTDATHSGSRWPRHIDSLRYNSWMGLDQVIFILLFFPCFFFTCTIIIFLLRVFMYDDCHIITSSFVLKFWTEVAFNGLLNAMSKCHPHLPVSFGINYKYEPFTMWN